MNKTKMISVMAALLASALMPCPSWAANYVAEPILVIQPVYSGMSFYVYRPYHMPTGWFMTYDGYPVTQSAGGNWVYGVPGESGSYSPSEYVVGSVVPMAVPELEKAGVPPTVHPARTPSGPAAPLVAPVWLKDGNFTAVAQWSRVVDRMAILRRPRLPLAWKGDRPSVIYGWTGKNWYQMICKEGESPKESLKRYVYELTRMAHLNRFCWRDSDTPALAAQAPAWGFFWMGLIDPIDL